MALNIEYQLAQDECQHCHETYPVVRGPVYENGEGVALYLVGLHRCSEQGIVAITIGWKRDGVPEAFTIRAWATKEENQMSFVDGELSPWASHDYLGRMLSAEDARASKLRPRVFELADLICSTIPEVVTFLNESLEAN